MKVKDKKSVDISEFTEVKPEEQQPQQKEGDSDMSNEDLLAALQEADPVLAMVAAQIFDIGNVVGDLVARVATIERHLGFLLSKDADIQRALSEAKKASKQTEDADSVEQPEEQQ